LVGRLERPVLVDRLRPRDGGRPRDVAAPLRALLLVAGHRDQLAGVLLGGADVDQANGLPERAQDLVALGADGVVAGLGVERRRREAGHLGGGGPALADPLLARAV